MLVKDQKRRASTEDVIKKFSLFDEMNDECIVSYRVSICY